MKHFFLILWVSMFLNSYNGIFAQEIQSNNFYYFESKKVDLSISQDQFVLYLNHGVKDVSEVINPNLIVDTVYLSEGEYAYRVHMPSENFSENMNFFREIEDVKSIEYVIGNTHSVMVSNLFYVQLKNSGDFSKLEEIAKITNSTILVNEENFLNWYTLRNDNKMLTSIEASNYFWETGLFKNVDPGFIFNFKYNMLAPFQCVSDAKFLTDQWNMSKINVCKAWGITTGNSSVKIAIIDSGVKESHQEFSSLNVVDRYDFTNNTSQVIDQPHGTNVGGIMFARHNDYNMAGVAPNVSLINLRVAIEDHPTFNTSGEFANAIIRAVNSGARVINNSWGDQNHYFYNLVRSSMLESALDYAIDNDVLLVFASGNSGELSGHQIDYPASAREEILAVGSINENLNRSSFSSFGNELDVVAPGSNIYTTSNSISNYYAVGSGTSLAAPHVTGIAALIFSINPNLTSGQVKNIIEQTAQKIGNYSYNNSSAHPNGTWNNQVGYGLVDAYAAVKAALDIDLYTRDNELDNGNEPLATLISGGGILDSPDIWLRRNADNGTEHQSGSPGEENHVYVRIHNRGYNTSLGEDSVRLYVKRLSLSPDTWSGWSMIGKACIPQIPSGSSAVVRIDATFPIYSIIRPYGFFYVDFAVLTRIESEYDGLYAEETPITADNVTHNNNISFKKVTLSNAVVIDDGIVTDVVVTALDNPTDGLFRTSLTFSSPANEEGNPLFKEAEIRLVFPKDLVQSWGSSYTLSGAKKINDSTFLVTGSTVKMENISIPANYEGYMMAKVNFLTEEYSEKDKYEYIVEQADPTTGEYQNGLIMIVDKTLRSNLFMAEGGNNVVANANTPANLSATAIGEDAVYNWYDASGTLVNSGQNISVTSSATQKYTLEVIAKADGYKDYDSVYVIRTLGNIVAISPNPTSGQAVVTYNLASSVSAASIVVTNSSGLTVYNSVINVSATTHTLNLQNLVAGQYSLHLVSATGEIMDTKTLLVQ